MGGWKEGVREVERVVAKIKVHSCYKVGKKGAFFRGSRGS